MPRASRQTTIVEGTINKSQQRVFEVDHLQRTSEIKSHWMAHIGHIPNWEPWHKEEHNQILDIKSKFRLYSNKYCEFSNGRPAWNYRDNVGGARWTALMCLEWNMQDE